MKTKNGVLGFELNLYPSDELIARFKDDDDWERLHSYMSGLIEGTIERLGERYGEWEIV